MRVVNDTNVLISGLFWPGKPSKILKLWNIGKIELLFSYETLNELNEKLRYKFQINELVRKKWIENFFMNSIILKPKIKFNIIKEDVFDNKFLELAYEGKAGYIISGDKHLLKLKKFRGIEVVNPHGFLMRRKPKRKKNLNQK